MADPAAPRFRRAVLALSGGATDRPSSRSPAELARPAKAELIGVHVVEIDWTLPLDADIAGRSEDAQRVLDIAEADRRGRALPAGARAAPGAGRRGGDRRRGQRARRRPAHLRPAVPPASSAATSPIGRTIPYVLKNAPCAVWVVREPMPEEQA